MATWLVWGRVELGRVEARDKDGAIAAAARAYPAAVGVQSLASWQVACEEAHRTQRPPRLMGDRANGHGRMGPA